MLGLIGSLYNTNLLPRASFRTDDWIDDWIDATQVENKIGIGNI